MCSSDLNARIAVDERDRALRARGVHERRVEGHQTRLRAELRDVECTLVFGAGDDTALERLIAYLDLRLVAHEGPRQENESVDARSAGGWGRFP